MGNLSLQVGFSNDVSPEESQTSVQKLIDRLGNVGVNARRSRLPLRTDPDYDTNDRDTFEFLGIVEHSCPVEQLKYEVLRRFRMGSRVVHPDKTSAVEALEMLALPKWLDAKEPSSKGLQLLLMLYKPLHNQWESLPIGTPKQDRSQVAIPPLL